MSEVMVVYNANDVAYIGYVEPEDLKNPSAGIRIEKPLVLNIRPIQHEEKLEAVVLDILIPMEMGGFPVAEGVYSGFINFWSGGNIDLPNGKTNYVQNPAVGRVAVNRIAAIADRENPSLILYNISKATKPSIELDMIYKARVAGYNELLFAPRAIDIKSALSDEESIGTTDQPPDESAPVDLVSPPTKTGNVVDLTSRKRKK